MPYVSRKKRDPLNPLIDKLFESEVRVGAGVLNYILTRIVHRHLERVGISYARLNEVMGVLTCVQQELYRTVAAPYEDTKMLYNGAVSDLDALFTLAIGDRPEAPEGGTSCE